MKKGSTKSLCNLTEKGISVNKLIGEIALLLANAISRENDANGIAQGYRAILFSLAENDGVTQFEISKRVGVKPPTTSVALSKMESEGYIVRTVNKDDLRKSVVSLTPRGREVVDNMLAVFTDCDKAIASVLTEDELQTLADLRTVVKERIYKEKEENNGK